MGSIALFEASESDHLKRAQAAIEEALAVQGKRTVENTLAPFDRAYDELQEAEEFANLVQNVHPDKAFRRCNCDGDEGEQPPVSHGAQSRAISGPAVDGRVRSGRGDEVLRQAPTA